MALFEKLFGKRDCEICGGDMGLLGNYKLADGDLCKKCAENISPIMRVTKDYTVAQIKEHLAYREENAKLLEEFNPTEEYGTGAKLFFDFEMKRFAYARFGDWKDENADIIPFEQVTEVEIEIEDDEIEVENESEDENAEPVTVDVSSFTAYIKIDSPWFSEIEIELTDGEYPAKSDTEKCAEYEAQLNRIKEILCAE